MLPNAYFPKYIFGVLVLEKITFFAITNPAAAKKTT